MDVAETSTIAQATEALRRGGLEDLQPGDDVMVRFAEGPKGLVVAEITGNYQRNRRHRTAIRGVRRLRVDIAATNGITRAQLYAIRVIEGN